MCELATGARLQGESVLLWCAIIASREGGQTGPQSTPYGPVVHH